MRVCPHCRSIYSRRTQYCGIDGERLRDRSDDPLIGQQVGRYKVLEKIGQGASGNVYRARHSELETDFAIKVLFGDLGSDETIVGRFRREAQTASKIRSPHVVSVVDFGTTSKGLTYLVMEYAKGKSLRHVIQSDAPMSPVRAASITLHIARGLAAAHRLGFIHRDVKPGNVFIAQESGQEVAKLLDFGIVRINQESGDTTKLTQHGLVVGTPAYMAPEQSRHSEVTHSADLYALGIVLYEMLAGRKPFSGTHVAEMVAKHAKEPPPALAPAGGLEALAIWMLAKEPAERPASAMIVAAEAERLHTLLSGSRSSETQATLLSSKSVEQPTQEVAPSPRSNRGLIAALIVVLVVALGAVGYASFSVHPAPVIVPTPPPSSPPEPPPAPANAEGLIEELDRLDKRVASLADRLPDEERARLEARYLELYKQIRVSQTQEGLEDLARSIRAFERELSKY